MSREFSTHFIANAINFFTSDLPENEEIYNAKYSLLITDWRAIQSDISEYHLRDRTQEVLKQLFHLAQEFNLLLKGSDRPYSSSTMTLANKWREIQALAKENLS